MSKTKGQIKSLLEAISKAGHKVCSLLVYLALGSEGVEFLSSLQGATCRA